MNKGVMLSIRGAGKPIELHIDREVIVGRASTSDVWLPFDFVSARHLRVFSQHDQWFVEDLGSTNGTQSPAGSVAPNTPLLIGSKLKLIIQDLDLEFSQSLPEVPAFTLALSGSIARQLVSDVAGPSGHAFVEVVSGPANGARFVLQDQMMRVGLKLQGAELVTTDVGSLFLSRDGEGFGLERDDTSPRRLRNGERFEIEGAQCVFFDPLEERLSPIPEPEADDVESDCQQDAGGPSEPHDGQDAAGPPDKKIPLAALLVLAAVVGIAVLILSIFLV